MRREVFIAGSIAGSKKLLLIYHLQSYLIVPNIICAFIAICPQALLLELLRALHGRWGIPSFLQHFHA